MKNQSLIRFEKTADIVEFLKNPAKVLEVITGILASDKHDWVLSTGKIVQASLKFKMLKQLGKELSQYAQKGVVKDDYFSNNKNQAALYELLKFIDEEVPDEERFRAMKSIFFSSVEKDAGKERKEIAYLLLQTTKQLSSGEVLILRGNYDVVKNTGKTVPEGVNTSAVRIIYWAEIISKKIGHNIHELVLQHEQHLIELKLISGPHHIVDRNRVTDNFDTTPYFRLTPLGYKLCEFITNYE